MLVAMEAGRTHTRAALDESLTALGVSYLVIFLIPSFSGIGVLTGAADDLCFRPVPPHYLRRWAEEEERIVVEE